MFRVNVIGAFDYSRHSFKHNFVMTTNLNNCPIDGITIIACPVNFHAMQLYKPIFRNIRSAKNALLFINYFARVARNSTHFVNLSDNVI